jgi:polyisoprenoid-binding protein YceI
MRVSSWKSLLSTLGAIAVIAVFLSATAAPPRSQQWLKVPPHQAVGVESTGQSTAQATAQEIVLVLDPAQTKLQWSVDSTVHTVHGTFAVKSGTVHFDPDTGKAGGEVIVLATSGDSGNSSRDQKMHKEILETAKFPDAVFRPVQIEGKVARSGNSDVKLRGVISLHGGEHEIIVPVHAELAPDRWKGTAKFSVPYIQWGIKDPSNWLLKVKPVVNVELEMTGTAKGAN